VQFHDVASDGAMGIHAGMRDAELAVPLRSDLFHLLHKAHQITRHLEAQAYQAIERTELARSIEQQAQEPKPRRGRPKTCKVSYAQAEQLERQAIERYDTGKGHSPVELTGVEQAYSWTEVLDLLVTQQSVPQAVC